MAVTTHPEPSPKIQTLLLASGDVVIKVIDTPLGMQWEALLPATAVAAFVAAISTDSATSTYDIVLRSGGALPPQAV